MLAAAFVQRAMASCQQSGTAGWPAAAGVAATEYSSKAQSGENLIADGLPATARIASRAA